MTVRGVLVTLSIAFAALAVLAGCSADSPTSSGPAFRARIPGDLFVADTAIYAGGSPWKLAVGDFAADGTVDIACANIRDGSVVILRNHPDQGIFNAQLQRGYIDVVYRDANGYVPRALAAADVDADGRIDLVIAYNKTDTSVTEPRGRSSEDRILVLLNRGEGDFEIALDDTIAETDIRDLYVGARNAEDRSVRIIAASSAQDVPLTEYHKPSRRAARIAQSDSVYLTLSGSIPEDGADGVSVHDFITVWFDFPVVPPISQLAKPEWIRVTGDLDGIISRDIAIASARNSVRHNPSTLIRWYDLLPVEPFLPGETVTLVIDNVRGSPTTSQIEYVMERPDTISFRTENLKVVASYPAPDEQFIPLDGHIEFAFNGPVDPASVTPDAFTISGAGGRSIGFDAAYDPTARSVTLTPELEYRAFETVTVTATDALRDTVGRDIFDPFTMSFQTTGPQVVATSPRNAEYHAETEPLTVLFNTSISVPPASAFIIHGERSGKHEVETVTQPADDDRVLKVQPAGGFFPGERVTVTVLRDVVDQNRVALARSHVWTYMAAVPESARLERPSLRFDVTYAGGTIAGGQFIPGAGGIALGDTSGKIGVLIPDGTGSWTSEEIAGTLPKGRSILRAADLTSNGMLDLVAVLPDSDAVRVYLNVSTGSTPVFADPVDYLVGVLPADVFIGDLSGNGYPDIATANTFSNDVSILINNGDGTFADERFISVGNKPTGIVGADFDGDGDIDLAVANSGDDTISLLRNLTRATSAPPAE